MQTRQTTLKNKLGLHARAASKLVTTATRFASETCLYTPDNDKWANCKSIMGVMMLGAGFGTRVTVTATGLDENQAAEALLALIEDRFGEGE